MGKCREFGGRKISLVDFIEEYKECFFEVIDEMSGFDQAEWTGRPNVPGERDSREMSLSIVFTEIIVYETAV